MNSKLFKRLALLLSLGFAIGLVAVPATGKATFKQVSHRVLAHMSGAPVSRYYAAHPELAPPQLRATYQAMLSRLGTGYRTGPIANPPFGDRFNNDLEGLPQNEESVSVCRKNVNRVLSGTNDYRGLLDSEGNFTGWHWASSGWTTLTNEGLLPHLLLQDGITTRPSGGDPVDVCRRVSNVDTLYAASLAYDPVDPFGLTSAIGVYKSTSSTLDTCSTDASCWPTSVSVAESAPDHFLDKEWMDVGDTGDGQHVWVTYTDFDNSQPCCFADIMAARCEADLSSCSAPIKIDAPTDDDVQFSDVTIGDDGRTYITYAQIIGEIEQSAQSFVVKMRIGDAGCFTLSCFGPVQTVYSIDLALPFGGLLQANDFRIASVPKSTVKILSNGTPRVFVVWDQCKARPLDVICEEPRVQMRYSDDDGATWSTNQTLSKTGVDRVDYFPSIDNDKDNGNLVVVWYTNRLDAYQNAQNIEMVTIDAASATITKRQTVTTSDTMPNEAEADPYLQGLFIGDYIEVSAHKGTAYIAYNMNIRKIAFLGIGEAVNQQDNYLSAVTE